VRKLLPNASYFAFTATPKNKTLETFGTADPHPDGMVRQLPFHSYTMKQAAVKIQLPDADAEIELVPTAGGVHKPEPELDRLSNILKTFNDQFGNIPWTDADRVHKLITEEIPYRVAAGTAYQNAKKNSDKQNARIEHDYPSRLAISVMSCHDLSRSN
jgi:type I site-specific restriction-modification system R (restriction) subunit